MARKKIKLIDSISPLLQGAVVCDKVFKKLHC